MKASAQLPIGEMNAGRCLEGEEVGYLRTAFVTIAHPIHSSTLMIMRLGSNKKKKILPLKEVLAGAPPPSPLLILQTVHWIHKKSLLRK